MANVFSGLVNSSFKQIFNDAIDSILQQNSLSTPCKLEYSTTNYVLCYNCNFDSIRDKSSGTYNNSTGTNPFEDGSICPVCMGVGKQQSPNYETVYMAVICDSKYWLNWGPMNLQIPNLAAQTLSKIDLLPKVSNASFMTILDSSQYDNTRYSRAGFPTLMGLGDQNYILTNWTK